MELKLITCFVTITDPDAALAFYRDTLGLEVRNDVEHGGHRWITVGAPGQDVDIVLSDFVNGSAADADLVAALVAKGGLNAVHFASPDLDALVAAVRAAGGEIVAEPADQPWGVRDCAFRDPSGNLIRVNQA